MDDARLVCRLQCLGNLSRDRQCLLERDRPARDSLREVLAGNELHHEHLTEAGACPRVRARFLHAVDLRDVRVVQRRERFRLVKAERD